MVADYDLAGIGIGPFNLSLASLLASVTTVRSRFFEARRSFRWHEELMLPQVKMQNSFLKDLVTGADPTSPYSFINYLFTEGLFYHFINTGRDYIEREEFERYCCWVVSQLSNLRFGEPVREIRYQQRQFFIRSDSATYTAKNICIGSGQSPFIPQCTKSHIGPGLFHAKSDYLSGLELTNKSLVIIGGGQTGAEICLAALKGHWGRPSRISFISRRCNFQPIDASPFANETFTPSYIEEFCKLSGSQKKRLVSCQKLTSDGISEETLKDLYIQIYQSLVRKEPVSVSMLPGRELTHVNPDGSGYNLTFENHLCEKNETIQGDIVILATGFCNQLPEYLEPVLPLISLNSDGLFQIDRNYCLDWEHLEQNSIYALNYGRNSIGISDPQTSLMAWRSGRIVNHLTRTRQFKIGDEAPCALSLSL